MEKIIKNFQSPPFKALVDLIHSLRGKTGCPWDKQQTPSSIARYLVEEAHELVETVETGDTEEICAELGDVLFHVFFLAHLFEDAGKFNILDVVRNNIEKMVRRHPHVFGESRVKNTEEIRAQWQRIKQQEKKNHPQESVLDSIPTGMPALMRAYRISERAAGTGFDWEKLAEVLEKVEEEWGEFKAALDHLKADPKNQEDGPLKDDVQLEFGDLIFTLVNVARFAGFHPETAVAAATRKFEQRFKWMEQWAAARGRTLENINRAELDRLWEAAKEMEKKNSTTFG